MVDRGLIKTGSIQKERTMTQTTIRSFYRSKGVVVGGGRRSIVKIDGVVQMVVAFDSQEN